MRKIIIISTLLLITSNIFAQKADQMIGVTAGQLALGGSVVADPIDAPSMLYNPAAIGVLEINKIGFDGYFVRNSFEWLVGGLMSLALFGMFLLPIFKNLFIDSNVREK